MMVNKEHEWQGDIDAPFATVTVSYIEALNIECAYRGFLREMIKHEADEVFINDAEQALFEWKTIADRADREGWPES